MSQSAKISVLLIALLVLAACNNQDAQSTSAAETATDQSQEEAVVMTEEPEVPATDESGSLIGTAWWVEDILAAGVVDNSRTTIMFTEDGAAAGNGGCNRFTGGYELDGENISFGQLAGTMMACPEALMNQDRDFHDALGQVTSWRIDSETGLLHLQNQDGETVIRAFELPPGEQA